MDKPFDFGGYATKNDLKCMDGRTIRKDAFKECDGIEVPLVWGHKHDDPKYVLGHAILENRDDGVYTYGFFNDTESGKNAKELVMHKDIKALSIYANQLVQKAGDVLHGMIREVSLCLAGANPGAKIEELSFSHDIDEDCEDFEAILFNGLNIELKHDDISETSEANEPSEGPEDNTPEAAVSSEVIEHADEPKEENKMAAEETKNVEEVKNSEKTIKDVYDSFTDEQKQVVNFMIGMAVEQAGADDGEEKEVSHNMFENDNSAVLAHDAMMDAINTVIKDGKKYGSLRESYEHHMQEGGALAHAIDTTGMTVPSVSNATYAANTGYGINGIEYLFPEARTLDNNIEFIKRDQEWVDIVLGGVHKSPFSRVKSIYANITEDEARARGYIKGNLKKNEFFSLIKRTTEPTTVYKKQKIDRDDMIDIVDYNIVNLLHGEMRLMYNEELARAILIGDGRETGDPDKIDETKIRPILNDVSFYTIRGNVATGADDEATAKNIIKTAMKVRKDYKGSGAMTYFTSDEWLTNMLLIEDGIGHPMYRTEAEIAARMRVKNIVTSPLFEDLKDADGNDVYGIMVNLNDYNVGTDKGGELKMFDDFNIDYNQQIYLMEGRCSGALVKPYSAIVLRKASGSNPT